jgi:hypothetical protein
VPAAVRVLRSHRRVLVRGSRKRVITCLGPLAAIDSSGASAFLRPDGYARRAMNFGAVIAQDSVRASRFGRHKTTMELRDTAVFQERKALGWASDAPTPSRPNSHRPRCRRTDWGARPWWREASGTVSMVRESGMRTLRNYCARPKRRCGSKNMVGVSGHDNHVARQGEMGDDAGLQELVR